MNWIKEILGYIWPTAVMLSVIFSIVNLILFVKLLNKFYELQITVGESIELLNNERLKTNKVVDQLCRSVRINRNETKRNISKE